MKLDLIETHAEFLTFIMQRIILLYPKLKVGAMPIRSMEKLELLQGSKQKTIENHNMLFSKNGRTLSTK